MSQKYGIIQEGKLILSENYQEGYKPVIFAEIPDNFDQMTQAIFQAMPIDQGDYIDLGIEIVDLPPQEDVEFGM